LHAGAADPSLHSALEIAWYDGETSASFTKVWGIVVRPGSFALNASDASCSSEARCAPPRHVSTAEKSMPPRAAHSFPAASAVAASLSSMHTRKATFAFAGGTCAKAHSVTASQSQPTSSTQFPVTERTAGTRSNVVYAPKSAKRREKSPTPKSLHPGHLEPKK